MAEPTRGEPADKILVTELSAEHHRLRVYSTHTRVDGHIKNGRWVINGHALRDEQIERGWVDADDPTI